MRYVYVMRCGEDHYKVGIAAHVIKRLKNLQTSNPTRIDVVATRLVQDAEGFERRLHEYLMQHRTDGGTEWFKLEPQQVIDLLVMISQEPEVLAVYDIIEMNKLLKAQLDNRREIRDDLARAVSYIKRQTEKNLAQKAAIAMQPPTPREVKTDEDIIDLAMSIFEKEGKASTSLLQRRLSIGYAKAARVIDALEKQGKISGGYGAYPRAVLTITDK